MSVCIDNIRLRLADIKTIVYTHYGITNNKINQLVAEINKDLNMLDNALKQKSQNKKEN